MKKILLAAILILSVNKSIAQSSQQLPPGHPQMPNQEAPANGGAVRESISPEKAQQLFVQKSESISVDEIQRVAMHHNGRVKPLDTLAKESMLFVSGSYGRWGLHSVQAYLAMIVEPSSPFVEIIEIRDPELRVQLGYLKTQRFLSLAELENSPLNDLATPLLQKQETKPKSLTESQKKVLETYQQYSLLRNIQSGEHFLGSVDFTFLTDHSGNSNPEIQGLAKTYLNSIAAGERGEAEKAAALLVTASRSQNTPELFKHYLGKMDLEIFYNKARLFLIACILYLLLGSLLLVRPLQEKIPAKLMIAIYLVPLLIQMTAIGIRVYITRFAPVTNMYGTMIWVSQGVVLFSWVLYILYRNRFVSGLMLVGSGLILMLTERTPLVLSPDLDPIVAVLRSNYWLSTHVTTITISYAAFTIAMILGNVALIRVWTHQDNKEFFKEYAHYAYRMIQLGVFLLTTGIILGGIWADYSWGRFWGWDPKETWALIADLGFLAILHARFAGWVKDFTLLAWCPAAYLLVIMAWYGVNFVLAAGLHSYGFSSGGATMIATFVSIQVGLFIASYLRLKLKTAKQIAP